MRWTLAASLGVWGSALGILASSAVLGLVFNASNPLGVRWSDPPPNAVPHNLPSPSPAPAAPSHPPSAGAPAPASQPSPAVDASAPARQYVPPTPTTWAEIKPRHAQRQVVLVDCRSRAAFEAAHIPGAVLLSEPPSAEDLAAFRGQYATNAHVVAYCGSTSCSLSFKLAHRLAREAGYGFVQYMTGGFLEWQREETLGDAGQVAAPTSAVVRAVGPRQIEAQTNAPVTPPVAAVPTGEKLEHALPILWSQAKRLLEVGQVLLLDARPKAEFDAGHVPGALWLPADATPEAIRQLLGGRPRTTRVVAYCGTMGCPEAFQLSTRLVREFDFPNAQFMLEGFAEWRRAEQPPPPRETPR